MKRIKAENVDYVYLLPGDEIPSKVDEEPVLQNYLSQPEIFISLQSGLDTRIAVSKFTKGKWSIDILFWNDSTDLVQLDADVLAGTYSDTQFINSVRVYPTNVTCFNCNHVWESLCIPGGEAYIGAPELGPKKFLLSRLKSCPNCDRSLRISVVKIFGEYKPYTY